MNDCFWCFIKDCCSANNCNGCCQYLSVNSSKGQEMLEEYSKEVEEYLEPLYQKYREKMKSFVNNIDNSIV